MFLTGVTAYFYGKPNSEDDIKYEYPGPLADFQFSFVFHNNQNLPNNEINQLITIERIENFSWKRYKEILKNFKETPLKPTKDFYSTYWKGGHVRNCCNQLLAIFYLVKHMYLPNLKISDDYNEFQEFEKRMRERGYDQELYKVENRWSAIEKITNDFLGKGFQQKHISSELKKLWNVEID